MAVVVVSGGSVLLCAVEFVEASDPAELSAGTTEVISAGALSVPDFSCGEEAGALPVVSPGAGTVAVVCAGASELSTRAGMTNSGTELLPGAAEEFMSCIAAVTDMARQTAAPPKKNHFFCMNTPPVFLLRRSSVEGINMW